MGATGITGIADAKSYYDYFIVHLVRKMAMPGILGVLDPTTGLYSSNSGPFASLTAKEIMEGWDDPIIQQLAPGTVYNGILSATYGSRGAQAAVDADAGPGDIRKYAIYTGSDKIENAHKNKHWRDVSEFDSRDDFGYSCTSTWSSFLPGFDPAQPENTCSMWESKEVVDGKSGFYRHPPITADDAPEDYKTAESNYKEIDIWVSDIKRAVRLVRVSSDEDVNGVRGQRFVPPESFYSADANYKQDLGNNLYPQKWWNDGIPAVASTPYFAGPTAETSRAELRDCFDMSGIDASMEWSKNLETYIIVEPLTGLTIEGSKRLQMNLEMTTAGYDKIAASGKLFTSTGCDTVYFPSYLTNEYNKIDSDEAALFTGIIYGAYDTLPILTGVGAAIMFIGLVVAFLGKKMATKTGASATNQK